MKFIVLIPFLITEPRIKPLFLYQRTAKSGRSIQDLLLWIINEQLPKPYNLAESNCQHFCFDFTQRFVDGENPLPGWLALTLQDLIGKQKSDGLEITARSPFVQELSVSLSLSL